MRIKIKRPRYIRVVDPYWYWHSEYPTPIALRSKMADVAGAANDDNFKYRVRNVSGAKSEGFLAVESRMPGSTYAFYHYVLTQFGKQMAVDTLNRLARAGHIKRRGPTRSGVDNFEMIAYATLSQEIIPDLLIEAFVERDKVSRRTARRRAIEFMKANAPSANELPQPTKAPVSILVSTFDRKGHEAAVRKLRIETDPYTDKKAR